MTSTSAPVLLVLGAGPGLGMSVTHRFGKEGYLQALTDAGVEAAAFTGDAMEPHSLRHAVEAARARLGRIDVGYYGPADFGSLFGDITTLDGAGAEEALRGVAPAVEFASLLIPELTERGSGGLLFAGGLSSVVPMPPLGGLALASAALRNYAITLNAALQPAGIYAGTITIGGLIDRGDIHQAMQANPNSFGDLTGATLNPDQLAETVWRLYTERTKAEAVINALAA